MILKWSSIASSATSLAPVAAGLRQVDLGQPLDLGLGRTSLSSARAKSNSGSRMNRLSVRSNQTKLVYCRIGAPVMKSNSRQSRSSSRWPCVVEHELVKRAVVAEVSRHAVKAGAEQPARVLLLLLRVEVDAGTLRDEEGVGEGRAEAREARPRTRRAAAGSVGTAMASAAAVPGVSAGRPDRCNAPPA